MDEITEISDLVGVFTRKNSAMSNYLDPTDSNIKKILELLSKANLSLNLLDIETFINILNYFNGYLKGISIPIDIIENIRQLNSNIRNAFICSKSTPKIKNINFNCSVNQERLPELIDSSMEVINSSIKSVSTLAHGVYPYNRANYDYLINEIKNLFDIINAFQNNHYKTKIIGNSKLKLIALINDTQENFSPPEASNIRRSFVELYSPNISVETKCNSIFYTPCPPYNLTNYPVQAIKNSTDIVNTNNVPPHLSKVGASFAHGVGSGLVNILSQAGSMWLSRKGYGQSKTSSALLSLGGGILQASYIATFPLMLLTLNKLVDEGNKDEAQAQWDMMVQEMLPTFVTTLGLSAGLQWLNYFSENYLSKKPTAKAVIQTIPVASAAINFFKNPIPTGIQVATSSAVSAIGLAFSNQSFLRNGTFSLSTSGESSTDTSETTNLTELKPPLNTEEDVFIYEIPKRSTQQEPLPPVPRDNSNCPNGYLCMSLSRKESAKETYSSPRTVNGQPISIFPHIIPKDLEEKTKSDAYTQPHSLSS